MSRPESNPAVKPPEPPAEPVPPALDLSHLPPPRELEAVRVEELTIDGICGVY